MARMQNGVVKLTVLRRVYDGVAGSTRGNRNVLYRVDDSNTRGIGGVLGLRIPEQLIDRVLREGSPLSNNGPNSGMLGINRP